MSIRKEPINFSGTIGDITYWQCDGKSGAHKKSSLTKERVLTDTAFEKTRKYAGDMGRASRIASFIYRALPTDIKGRWIFRAITGDAASLIYQGKEDQEVKDILWEKYMQETGVDKNPVPQTAIVNKQPSSKKINLKFESLFLTQWIKQGKDGYWFTRAWEYQKRFNPETIPRRSEYFQGLLHAIWKE